MELVKPNELTRVFTEVPIWSSQMFGDQKGLNHLAPLLGILEELGELEEAGAPNLNALMEEMYDAVNDAVGDIGIYTIDFLTRLGIAPVIVWPSRAAEQEHSALVYLARLNHACLKRHQGIRGFDVDVVFNEAVIDNTAAFLHCINNVYDLSRGTINTWKNVVSKRNWKANPDG